MAPPTQRGLLFHRRNGLSRTNCCFQLAWMVAENHIIIQQQWMAANCSVSAAVSLFSSRRTTTKGFRLTESSKTRGFEFPHLSLLWLCFVQMRPVLVRINPHTVHENTCFPSFVNDFSLNWSCTLAKKCSWRNSVSLQSTILTLSLKTSFHKWNFRWKDPARVFWTSRPAWVLFDLLMGELQDVPGQMGYCSSSSIFRPLETCFPICCIPLCDALKTC